MIWQADKTQRYPAPGPPLPAIEEGRVWLFHGTTPSIANEILRVGWSPPDPLDHISATGANEVTAVNATERFRSGAASCDSSWRMAANYARRGPEYLYQSKLPEHDYRPEDAPPNQEGAVLLLSVPWEAIVAIRSSFRRSSFLPDNSNWTTADIGKVLDSGPFEVRLPGPLIAPAIVGIDHVASTCLCTGSIISGDGLPPNDPRLRCSVCYLGPLSSAPTVS